MRRGLQITAGLLPLLLGLALQILLIAQQTLLLPYFWLGIVFLIVWATLGYHLCGWDDSIAAVTVRAHAIALAFLLINLFQTLILGHFFANALGSLTQSYFLILLNLGTSLVPGNTIQLWMAELAAFILMVGAFYAGCRIRRR